LVRPNNDSRSSVGGVIIASLVAALLGGLLALLAPCGALLLPAFLAYSFSNRSALLRATLIFLLGLCLVLLPAGLAASLAGQVLIEHRDLTITAAGTLLIALGALLAFGRGLSPLPALPATGGATLMTGVVYGLTGYCAGPLLGGILTLAAASANLWLGALLLLCYAVGMVAPLLLLALLWDHFRLGHKPWLRSAVRHSAAVGGALFVSLGVAFIASQGGLVLSGIYDGLGLSDLSLHLEAWLADLACNAGAVCT
jgi:cytochrome c biogenesis protein CcdA